MVIPSGHDATLLSLKCFLSIDKTGYAASCFSQGTPVLQELTKFNQTKKMNSSIGPMLILCKIAVLETMLCSPQRMQPKEAI